MKCSLGSVVLLIAAVLVAAHAFYTSKDYKENGTGSDKVLAEEKLQMPEESEEVLAAGKFLLKLPKFPESDYSELNNLKIKEDAHLDYSGEDRSKYDKVKTFTLYEIEKGKGYEYLYYKHADTPQNLYIKELIRTQLNEIDERAKYSTKLGNIKLTFKYEKEIEEPAGEVVALWQEEVENSETLSKIRLIAYLNSRENYLYANDDFSRMYLKLSDTLTLFVRKEADKQEAILTYKLIRSTKGK